MQKELTALNNQVKKWQMRTSVLQFKIMYMGKTIFHKQLWALSWLQPCRKGDVETNTDDSMKKGLSTLCY